MLHFVINPNQTCGVPGRFIGENVALLRDLVDYTSESGTPAAILSLDQEKAFHRVDWPFLFQTLSCLGFGQSSISWVRLLYTGIRTAILVNGYTSDFFWPSRGVRQGCPLSPLLYVISIEVLAANLRAHQDIVGLRPLGLNCTLPVVLLYADDTWWWLVPLLPSAQSSARTSCLREALAPGLISINVRVSGLARGGSPRPPHR